MAEAHVEEEKKESEGEQPFEVIPGTNLYVKNIDDNVDEEWLERVFGKFGTITSVKVMRHSGGASKGFGFVCFATAEEAGAAKLKLNGRLIGTKPLYINIAQKKEERAALLKAHFNKPFHERDGNGPAPARLQEGVAPAHSQNGGTRSISTPPRTGASPHVPNGVVAVSAKPVSLPAPLPVVAAPSGISLPQQAPGMNSLVFMRQPVGQPVGGPRPANFVYGTSAMPHPGVPHVQYAQVAPWPAYPVSTPQAAQGQSYVSMRPAQVPITQIPPAHAPLTVNTKLPHVCVHCVYPPQNQGVIQPVPIPIGMAQNNMQTVRPIGLAAYPQPRSVWINGMR